MNKFSRHAGFTLIELLIVLAIIGLITALLLPVIQNSRRQSYQTNCANNLRQIGTAFKLYEQDCDALPPHASYLWNAHYVTNSNVLVCKADVLGDFGSRVTAVHRTEVTGKESYWPEFAPVKTSYIYVKDALGAPWVDPFNPINGDNPNPGIFVCQSHGQDTWQIYHEAHPDPDDYQRLESDMSGTVLRLNLDGSIVVRRYLPYPVHDTDHSYHFEPHIWYLWMDPPSKCKDCNPR